MAKKKRKVWKGGPRSRRSYVMDQYRQSSEPWEKRKPSKGGKVKVRKHYRTTKKGSVKVKYHKRKRR